MVTVHTRVSCVNMHVTLGSRPTAPCSAAYRAGAGRGRPSESADTMARLLPQAANGVHGRSAGMTKYVIVGNGVTGTRAAEVIRRADESADVTILTEEPHPFYRRPQLADFASGEVGEARMWARKRSFYEDNRFDLRLSTKVVGLDVDGHVLALADGGSVPFNRLLVATGRDVTSERLRGGDLPGVNPVSYTHLRAHETDSYLVC